MRKNRVSGFFNPRLLLAFALCSVSVLLTMLSFASTSDGRDTSQYRISGTRISSAASLTQAKWTQIGSYAPPPNREMVAMVFYPDTQTTILFGAATLGWGR